MAGFPAIFLSGGNMEFKVLMQLLIGIVGFAIWTFIVFYAPDLNNSEYLKFVQGSVLTVVALALRDTVQAKVGQPVQDLVADEVKTKEPQQ
jgi:hypothetical protein